MKSKGPTSPTSNGKAGAARPSRSRKAKASPGDITYSRERAIAEAAYFRAEQRGFAPGNEMADWFEAEAEIDRSAGGRP